MAGKRYYWLKLQVSFFQELIIKQLRTLPEGDSIVLLYLKLLLKAINTEGIIYYQNILPSLHEEIALDTGEKVFLVWVVAVLDERDNLIVQRDICFVPISCGCVLG